MYIILLIIRIIIFSLWEISKFKQRLNLQFRKDFLKIIFVIMVRFLDLKPGFELQARQQNKIQKVFLRWFHLSRFLAKTLRINNIVMKNFSKICRSESTLNCGSRHLCIKLTHTK